MRTNPLSLLALTLALAGCHHTTAPALSTAVDARSNVAVDARPNVAPTRPTAADAAADPQLFAMADQIAQEVSTRRQLTILQPIVKGVMDRAEILAHLRRRARQEYQPGEIELEGAMLKRTGMIPDAMDYERTIFDLLEEQVAGFYDPDARTLYLAAWAEGPMQTVTLSHEITHALQDQHFGIARFTHRVRGEGDAQSGAMAVVEGDATLTMLDVGLAHVHRSVADLGPDPDAVFRTQIGDLSGQPRLAAAPRALREMLLFPYRYGFDLCATLYAQQGGYGAIDAALRAPPRSTEQVLHPDKFLAHEAPVALAARVPAPLATDHALAYDDVLGELGLRLFLETWLPDEVSVASSRGWGGDRAVLLTPRGLDGARAVDAAVMVWTIEFDPATGDAHGEDAFAQAFSTAAIRASSQRYAGSAARSVGAGVRLFDTGSGRVALVARVGRRVVIADRVPADRAEMVARDALAATGAAP